MSRFTPAIAGGIGPSIPPVFFDPAAPGAGTDQAGGHLSGSSDHSSSIPSSESFARSTPRISASSFDADNDLRLLELALELGDSVAQLLQLALFLALALPPRFVPNAFNVPARRSGASS